MPVFVAAATVFASTGAEAGAPDVYRVLHSFCSTVNCGDGANAAGTPALDANGNLYGVALVGGRFDNGTLYELSPVHGGASYFKHVLKAFCDPNANCSTGYAPLAGPIMDLQGNLYGTTSDTSGSGASSTVAACGAVYMAFTAPVKATGHPNVTALHQFGGKDDGCNPNYGSLDYQGKESGQAYDGVSPLYGTTSSGGGKTGVVYQLTPPGSTRKSWSEQLIYTFCELSDCIDGQNPTGNLVMDAAGDLFGTTHNGRVFELTPDGAGGFNYSVIYTSTTGETYGALAIENDGTLIGVSDSGGATGNGTLFSLARPCSACGARYVPYQYTLLHDFCSGGGNCADGAGANSVVIGAGGNIFGTTGSGGSNDAPPNSGNTGGGTVFEYSGASFFPIHEFCAQTACADGGAPLGGLTTDGNGNFFGTTSEGGSTVNVPTGAGVVFELSVPS